MAWTEARKKQMVATRRRNQKLKKKGLLPVVVPQKEVHPDELPVVMLENPPQLEDFTRYMVLAWKLLHKTERN